MHKILKWLLSVNLIYILIVVVLFFVIALNINTPILTSLSESSFFPSIAVSGNNVHIIWVNNDSGTCDIYYKHIGIFGLGFSTLKILTSNISCSSHPSLLINKSEIYIFWQAYLDQNIELFYKYSSDGGNTWNDNMLINTNNPSTSLKSALGNKLHIIMNFDCNSYYISSDNKGINWSDDIRLNNIIQLNSGSCPIFPQISVVGDNIHTVVQAYYEGHNEVFYLHSNDNGLNWSNIVFSEGLYPSIATNSNNIYIIWEDYSEGKSNIFFSHSNDNGLTWGEHIRITNSFLNVSSPLIFVEGSKVYVFWMGNKDGYWNLYYTSSDDSDLIWSNEIKLIENCNALLHPSIAIYENSIYAVWENNSVIYYSKT